MTRVKVMESSIRTWSLARSSLRTVKTLGRSGSVNSVSGDSGIDSEYTHVSVGSSGFYPSLYIKIKYPTEADDAARSGMLTSCDFDEILEKLQDVSVIVQVHNHLFIVANRFFRHGKSI